MFKYILQGTIMFSCLLFTSNVFGEISIKKEHRVANISPGYCAWACIETLGNHHKIDKLKNLVKNRSKESDVRMWDEEKGQWIPLPNVIVRDGSDRQHEVHRSGGWIWAVRRKLDSLGVEYHFGETAEGRLNLIKMAMKNDLGCVFIVKAGWRGKTYKGEPSHALVLLDINDKEVKYLDPNDITKVFTRSRDWFDEWSFAYVLVVAKNKK